MGANACSSLDVPTARAVPPIAKQRANTVPTAPVRRPMVAMGTPSLARLKRRNPGSRGRFATQPVADANEALPENPTDTHPCPGAPRSAASVNQQERLGAQTSPV